MKRYKERCIVKKWALFFAFFIIFSQYLPSLEITAAELGHDLRMEYSRTFPFYIEGAFSGGVELNNRYELKTGAAFGSIGSEPEFKVFGCGGIALRPASAIKLNLSYIFHSLPGYEMCSHSIMPWLSYDGQRWGAGLGLNLQFSEFFGEYSIFESTVAISVNFNIVNNDNFKLAIKAANFSDFNAANLSNYALGLSGICRLNPNLAVTNQLELLQRGSAILAAKVYGFAFTGGIKVLW